MDVLKKINYLFDRKVKISLIGLFFVILVGSAVELLGVSIVLPIVNLAIETDYSENIFCRIITKITGYTSREDILLALVVITIVIYLFKFFYISWMNSTLYQFAANVKRELATKLMKAYMMQPYTFFLQRDSAQLIRSINSDTGSLYEVIVNCLLILSNGITAIALLVTIIVINPVMACLVACLLVLCAVAILLIVQKRTRSYGKRNQQLSSDLIKYLQQSFEGIKEIKILGCEKYFVSQYDTTYREQADVGCKSKLVNLIPKYLIEAVCIIGIMLYLGWNVKFNPNYMSLIPQLAMFVGAAYKLLPAVNAVYAYMNTIVYHRASIDLVYHDIKEANELIIPEGIGCNADIDMPFNKQIAFKNVSFGYGESNKLVLDNVSITIPKGKTVAFIGPSGGGKTTTADLVIGLLTPSKGAILIDDCNMLDYLGAWRRKIGYIPQTIYLTEDSIKRNIALGLNDSEIDEQRVWKVLEQAQLADFVKKLPNGIETNVGERGTRLSGGQRQRIGIARALYHNPEVLVFDEATSALDNNTEHEVMQAIEMLHGSKTMIMIAHRLSTIENSDIVYKVENGKVIKESEK